MRSLINLWRAWRRRNQPIALHVRAPGVRKVRPNTFEYRVEPRRVSELDANNAIRAAPKFTGRGLV